LSGLPLYTCSSGTSGRAMSHMRSSFTDEWHGILPFRCMRSLTDPRAFHMLEYVKDTQRPSQGAAGGVLPRVSQASPRVPTHRPFRLRMSSLSHSSLSIHRYHNTGGIYHGPCCT